MPVTPKENRDTSLLIKGNLGGKHSEAKPLIPPQWKSYIKRKTLDGPFKVITCLMKDLKLFGRHNWSAGTVCRFKSPLRSSIRSSGRGKASPCTLAHPQAIWLLKSSRPSFACLRTGAEGAAGPLKLLLSGLFGAQGQGLLGGEGVVCVESQNDHQRGNFVDTPGADADGRRLPWPYANLEIFTRCQLL